MGGEYDISIEIRELEIPSFSDLDSGDNKPDAIVRFTTMNHEKFTSQKGGTLHADWSDDENDKKRLVFCDHDGSDVDFQVLDNDADYEELVRGEHTNYDVAFSDSYPFDFSTLGPDEESLFGMTWSSSHGSVIRTTAKRWDTERAPGCGDWWVALDARTDYRVTIEFTRGFSNNMDRRLATDWDCHATHNGIKYPTNSHVEDDNTPGPGELGSVKIYGYYMGDDITVKCVDDDGWLGGEDNIGSAHITSDDIYPNGNDALYLSLNGNNFIYVKVGLSS